MCFHVVGNFMKWLRWCQWSANANANVCPPKHWTNLSSNVYYQIKAHNKIDESMMSIRIHYKWFLAIIFSLSSARIIIFCLQAIEEKKIVCINQHFSSVFRFYFFSLYTSATLFSYSEWFFIRVRTTDAIYCWIDGFKKFACCEQHVRLSENIYFLCVESRFFFPSFDLSVDEFGSYYVR